MNNCCKHKMTHEKAHFFFVPFHSHPMPRLQARRPFWARSHSGAEPPPSGTASQAIPAVTLQEIGTCMYIYIYIMIYHDILYNISIVFMGFINQLMMPNAYFWMMLVSQCHFNYSHEHHINFPWQSVAFLRWGTQELWPHVLDGAEECDTEPGISPSSQNRGI